MTIDGLASGAPRGVVAAGASAGGVQALGALLAAAPTDAGLVWLVVLHLDPTRRSRLAAVLQRSTSMPVRQAIDGMRLQPNTVHVIAPGTTLTVDGDVLHVVPRQPGVGPEHLAQPLQSADPELRAQPVQRMQPVPVAHPARGSPHPAHPVDALFASLAQPWGSRAAGVVLSGTGSDGVAGLRALRDAGGLTAVQQPASAAFAGMPEAALAAGPVDCVDVPGQLPMRLLQAFRARAQPVASEPGHESVARSDEFGAILERLRVRCGLDLSLYKRSTLLRRVRRRMDLHRIDSLARYGQMLAQSEAELDMLGREVLIGVTAFFRDRDVWQALRDKALPALLAARDDGTMLRAWVPGCSTGEEAYSLAMVFREAVEAMPSRARCTLQIFATDLNADAIGRARRGCFQGTLRGEVSAHRLERFFVAQSGGGWRIASDIRETVVFAPHDVNRDPPFTRLDLISCRNLLIYFTAPLQRRLLPMFHYGLQPDGVLLLGSSESIGRFDVLFETLDARLRLYRRRPRSAASPMTDFSWRFLPPSRGLSEPSGVDVSHDPAPPASPAAKSDDKPDDKPWLAVATDPVGRERADGAAVPALATGPGRQPAPAGSVEANPSPAREVPGAAAVLPGRVDLQATAERFLMASFSPPALLVGERGDILYIHGRTGRFLEPAAGRANWNVLVMARPGLRDALADAMRQALATQREVQTPALPLEAVGGAASTVRLQVMPLDATSGLAGTLLVAFHAQGGGRARKSSLGAAVGRDLEFELQNAREEAQSLREEMRASQEELQAANEELQSTNEELQSTNEELTSSKEAMQSMNEELQSVNSELKAKLDDLAVAHSDIRNLLNSTDIATLFLDRHLNVRRFTERARRLISLRDSDVGRPIGELASSLDYPQLEDDVREMLRTLLPGERRVRSRQGAWFAVRILPYRTQDDVIDGAVLTFVDAGAVSA